MATKDFIALGLFFAATLGGVLAAGLSGRARDAAFFLMIVLAPLAHKLDVNFFSHYWYRGTTRGLEVSVVDILAVSVLAGSLLFPRDRGPRFYWPAGLGLMLLFFAYACGDVALADPKVYGLFALSKMLRGLLFFLAAALYIRSDRELALLVLALGSAVCFEGALAVKQRLFDGVYRVTGTLDDPNSFSMYLCTVSPLFVAAATSTLSKWVRRFTALAAAATAVSLVLTLSRAGLAIYPFIMLGAALCCVSWRLTAKKIVVTAAVVLAAGVLLGKQFYLIEARWAHDSLEKEYDDPNKFESRGYYLRLARVIMAERFFGVGLNNWSYWVSKKYGAMVGTPYEDYDDLTYMPSKELLPAFHYAAPAHCLAALTVGELGVPGLLIFFGLLWPRWFQMGLRFLRPRVPDATRRLGAGLFFCTCGIFLQSVTEWVYWQEQIFITFHLLLGVLAALCWLKRKTKLPRRATDALPPRGEERMEYEPVAA